MRWSVIGCALVVLSMSSAPVFAADNLKFHPQANDRVAFFGDSITHQDLYTTFVATYYLNFKPELNLSFLNAGVGGNKLADAIARVDRDLVPFNPTAIVIFFGMND